MVRYPSERRGSYAELLNERIRLPGSRAQAPLYTVAGIRETESQANRLRIDGRAAAVVTANLDIDAALSGDVAERAENELVPQLKARYEGLEVRKHGGSRDVERLGDTLLVSALIALLAIYCLVASFLRSFIQPALVLAGIPVAFVGAAAGHWLLGYEFTITSLFGLIAVSGVVVNDTILLMHRYNAIRAELPDVPEIAAISAAARQRARAILLTSFTTVVGPASDPVQPRRSDPVPDSARGQPDLRPGLRRHRPAVPAAVGPHDRRAGQGPTARDAGRAGGARMKAAAPAAHGAGHA